MKQVLARRASLSRKLLIGTDNGVADCAFSLALEGSGNVLSPSREAVGYAAVLRVESVW